MIFRLKTGLWLLACLLLVELSWGQNLNLDDCPEVVANESLGVVDFLPLMRPMEQVAELAQELYQSPKRAPNPFYVKNDVIYYSNRKRQVHIEIPASFVSKILKHLQRALDEGWAEWIMASDLGHGHFQIPYEVYVENQQSLKPSFGQKAYSFLASNTEVKVLYHSYEFVKRPTHASELTEQERERLGNRNLLGSFSDQAELQVQAGPGDLANTTRSIEGYHGHGGLGVQAHQNGCFQLQGSKGPFRLDISFDSAI